MVSALVVLRKGQTRAVASLAGGAILEAEVGGVPLLRPSRSPGLATRIHGREACFPLVPFGGRIEGNAFPFAGSEHRMAPNTEDPLVLHGDGWLCEWSVIGSSPDQLALRLDIGANGRSPYAFRAEQCVELLPEGMRLSLSVENRGPETLPFGLGFHPYLPVTPEVTVQFDAAALWSERAFHLPHERRALSGALDFTKALPVPDIWINTCYENWTGRAILSAPTGQQLLLVGDPVFEWLMVYKPEGQGDFLCLEPMTHRPNSHGSARRYGLRALAPGDRISGSMELSLCWSGS